MFERIMLLKLDHAHAHAHARAEVAREAQRSLRTLPGLQALSVALPADAPSEKSWDVSVVMRFADAQALSYALASPALAQFLGPALEGRCAVVKAWSFEALPDQK